MSSCTGLFLQPRCPSFICCTGRLQTMASPDRMAVCHENGGANCWMLAAKRFSPHISTVNTATRRWLLRKRFAWRSSKALGRRNTAQMLAPVPTAQFLTQSLFWRGWKVSSAVLVGEPAAGRPCRDRFPARCRPIAEEAVRQAQAEAVVGEGAGKEPGVDCSRTCRGIKYRGWTNDERLRPVIQELRDLDDTSDVYRLRDRVAARFPATRTVTSFCVWRIDFSSG
ncbi:Hypothetical protein NGAL_HAMBI2566_46280 [Neorhizobium galegae bv. orientalis]|nr:Hypothetical protein NGAL_HAMBI2566_46280 [Neorhizobium galegae bv. orientalis]